jgi:hypothetical protein
MKLTVTCIVVEQIGESRLVVLTGNSDGIAQDFDIMVKNPELQKLFEKGNEYIVEIKPKI